MVASPRHGRGSATRTRRGGRRPRGRRRRCSRGPSSSATGRATARSPRAGIAAIVVRRGRCRARRCAGAAAPAARPGGRGHGRRRRRPDRSGRVSRSSWSIAGDLLVELARPRARLPRVPRARAARRERSPAAPARRGARWRSCSRAALGWALARRRDPVALPGRRPHRAAARARRLLERARAPRGRARSRSASGSPASPRSRGGVAGSCSSTARRSRCCSRSRGPGVVGALAVLGPLARLSDERLDDALRAVVAGVPRSLVGGLGVHAARARRGRRAARRPGRRREGLRGADDRGRDPRRSRRAGGFRCARLVERQGRPSRRALVASACSRSSSARWLVAKVGNPSPGRRQLSRRRVRERPRGGSPTSARTTGCLVGGGLDVAADRPVGGSGAGTFALARRRYREDATPGSEPHSVPLQLLADLGVVGLGLGLSSSAARSSASAAGPRVSARATGRGGASRACSRVRGARARRLRPRLPRRDRAGARRAGRAARGGRPARRVAPASRASSRSPPSPEPPSLGSRCRAAQRDVDRAFEATDAGRLDEAVDAADAPGASTRSRSAAPGARARGGRRR